MAGVTSTIIAGAKVVYEVFVWLRKQWQVVVGGINYIADLIYWDEIKQIHRIAYAVSSDYQEMWRGVMKVVRNVSVSIGRDADFLSQILISSRNLIYVSSTIAGHPLDICEQKYLAKTQAFFQRVNWSAEGYAAHPERIFTDIEALLVRESHYEANAAQQRLWTYVLWSVQKAKEHMAQLQDLNKVLSDFQTALPGNVKGLLDPILQSAIDALDFTETSVFQAYIDTTDKAIKAAGVDIEAIQADIGSFVDAIKKPGDWLLDLTHLGSLARSIVDSRAARVASDALGDAVDTLETAAQPIMMELQALAAALKVKIPPVEWHVPEVEAPAGIPIGEIDPVKTWYVGDY